MLFCLQALHVEQHSRFTARMVRLFEGTAVVFNRSSGTEGCFKGALAHGYRAILQKQS